MYGGRLQSRPEAFDNVSQYLRRYRKLAPMRGARAFRAMGDLASTVGTALDVASDPYLSEVVCRVQQLKQIDHGEPVATCASTPDGVAGGVGLRNAIPVLRGYVYAQEHPWVYPVAVALILGIPMWIGYELAKGGR